MRRNAAYIRVANKDDDAIEIQKQTIDTYASNHNIKIDFYYIDNGYSGTNLDRPQLKQLIRDVTTGKVIDKIIFKDISRLGRDTKTLFEIVDIFSKRKVKLISLIEDELIMSDLIKSNNIPFEYMKKQNQKLNKKTYAK